MRCAGFRRPGAGIGAFFVCLLLLIMSPSGHREHLRAQASDPCATTPVNPIACENSKAGNPASEWDISGSGSSTIQGFATDISVNRGETIGFKVDTPATSHRLDIYRLGYYGGLGARRVAQIHVSTPTSQPNCTTQASTGLIDCGVWSQTASWAVPANAVSGVYIAKLVRTDGPSGSSHIVFIVRDDSGQSPILFQTSDTTWQAYNQYGGNSLYVGSPAGRAYKVSYNRPFTTRGTGPEDWVFNAEYPMIRWLEANGYNVSYFTGVDSDRRGAEILEHRLFLSVGHDEYWSGQQRANVEAARAAGVHLSFFSGNEVFWKTRWENSIDGSNRPYRTLVTYKETHADAKIDPLPGVWTGTWRDPRFSPPDDGGRPENALTGQLFTVNCCTYAIRVPEPFGKMRLWRNTSVATLGAGQTATLSANTLGYEWDEDVDNGFRPAGLFRLSSTTVNVPEQIQDYGSSYGSGTATHSLTMYRAPSGALVFGAGTVQWSWGLDATHDRTASPTDVRIRQATVNLFADMGVQPSTLQSGLVAATASSDLQAPTSTITSPANGATVANGAAITISGTASDVGGIVAGVEVSVDGGATWRQATGRGTWTFSWTAGPPGTVNLKSRAIDDSGNTQTPGAGNTVTVGAGGAGPVASYGFEEGAGTAVSDSSGTGNNGTSSNATWTTSGRFGKALTFNGTNAMVTVPDSASLDLTNAMTLEAWIRPTVLSNWRTVLLKEAGNEMWYGIYANDDTSRPSSWVRIGTTYNNASGTTGLSVNTWTHVAMTYDGANQRFYVNGTQVATRALTGSAGTSTNPLRIGGNSLWGEYFSGQIDEVRLYARALSAAEIATDMNTPVAGGQPDTTPPTVSATAPAANATNVATGVAVTATFNEPVDASTITSSTFQIRDAASQLVSGTVTYDPGTTTARFVPSPALQVNTTYTGTLRGGTTDPRVKDTAGNALAATFTWSFTTVASLPAPPDEGPGGPILIVASAANPITRYLAEIIRTEGLNFFTVTDLSLVTATRLNSYDVVVLGDMPLTAAQVTMLTDWVNAGGNLIAMRPDKKLAGLLGLTDAGSTLANRYIKMTTSGAGAGLVSDTIQFHGIADRYTLNGATAIATLYSSATTATTSPAVSLRNVGVVGGQAAAFTYDLARSVAQTRQGNPAWAGQNRDGDSLIRSDDLFFGDDEPDWIDLDKVAIPQADEQQRLLANLILTMNTDRKPLPRSWYLPRGLKAAVVMTGDDHGNNGTTGRFEAYRTKSPAGCSVADWQCVRSTSYIYPNTPLTNASAANYVSMGFEVATHVTTDCEDYTEESLDGNFDSDLGSFASKYTSVPAPVTNRTHCIPWSDYSSHPRVSRAHGIRFDTNYYFYPPSWVQNRPGLFTGSGMPMRFTDENGATIDVFQATTQMTDESGQTYPFTIDTLLDRAVGPLGYYGVFTANMHTDQAAHAGSDAIVASAQARGVPVVSAKQMLTWLDGRNASTFSNFTWSSNVLNFNVNLGTGATGFQVLLPRQAATSQLQSLTRGGSAVSFTIQTIKGIEYVVFTGTAGAYRATYTPTVDTTITSAPAATTTSTSASFSFTASLTGSTFQCSLDGAAFATCTSPRIYTGLATGAHTFAVRAVNGGSPDPTPAAHSWAIVQQIPDTTITSSPPASTSATTATFTFTATVTATFECSIDSSAFTACVTPVTYTGLALGGHTFAVRAVNALGPDPTPATFSWTITTPPPPPPPPANLVLALGFEEGTGTTTADNSGNGNNGTLSNATWTTAGRFGNALSFNGTNAWVTVADANSLDLTTAMTIEAWVRPSATTDWRSVLLKERSGGLAYALYASDGTRPSSWIWVGTELNADGTGALSTTVWTHLAATYDGTTMRFYVNGTQVATRAVSGSIGTSTSPLRIGGNTIWGEYFSGLIDEVRVYARVLTATEIQTDMNTAVKP